MGDNLKALRITSNNGEHVYALHSINNIKFKNKEMIVILSWGENQAWTLDKVSMIDWNKVENSENTAINITATRDSTAITTVS